MFLPHIGTNISPTFPQCLVPQNCIKNCSAWGPENQGWIDARDTIFIRFQKCPVAHPDTYHVATGGSFPKSKAIGCEAQRLLESGAEVTSVWTYSFAPPLHLPDMVLKGKGTHTYSYNIP